MNVKKLALLALAALCFATLTLSLLVGHSDQGADRRLGTATETAATVSGKLDIRTMADLRIGGSKVLLCGVSFNKPAAMEPLVREQARQAFQGSEVNCIQVGGGTPCDGRSAPSFDGAMVVQCRKSDGSDIAREFSDSGYLCDVPAQSGGIYHAC